MNAFLKNRIDEAKRALAFSHANLNKDGVATTVDVPGHDAKFYNVILRRNGSKIIGECRLNTGVGGYVNCKGNDKTVCYHVMAAAMKAAECKGIVLTLTGESVEDAKRLNRIKKGHVVSVGSRWNGKEFWAVAVAKK